MKTKQQLFSLMFLFCLLAGKLFAQAEMVNYEETWQKFLKEPLTSGVSKLAKPVKTNVADYLKYCMMYATSYFCADKLRESKEMLAEIKKIGAVEYAKIVGFQERYEDLEKKVAAYYKVNELWNSFLTSKNIGHEELEKIPAGKTVCEKGTLAKYFYISAHAHYCKGNLAAAKTDFESKVLSLVEKANLDPKSVVGLPAEIKDMKDIIRINETLDKVWAEYIKTDVSPGFKEDLKQVDCYVIPNIKIYVLRAMADICNNGAPMMKKIKELLKINTHPIPEDLQKKLDWLDAEVTTYNGNIAELNKSWKEYIASDTLAVPFPGGEFCDKIMQVKSWCLVGHYNTCKQGQEYLTKIDEFQKKHSLSFDSELACRVTRLRLKVWDCRYWELVEQAWALTHEEREVFGPKSASIMFKDLNGPKQVCETKVDYEPLGKIGIRYVIKIYLCQNVDLAKMGDPEYYKKIAKWIDNEVLVKYCSADFRCKKDFQLYIEGHTDGNPMASHKYKEPFNLPKGTPYTHFIGAKDTLQKVTEKDIMYELKTNMELGLGRAWTVKKQLDFIGAPVKIGAYEHPANEKGGEYRRMEVELDIPNLLLDFFEVKLKDLIEKSGIGPQPKNCKS